MENEYSIYRRKKIFEFWEWVEDYYLQLVAYAEAHNKMYDTKITTGRIFICTHNNEYQTLDIDNYDYWVGQWYAKLEQYYKSIL